MQMMINTWLILDDDILFLLICISSTQLLFSLHLYICSNFTINLLVVLKMFLSIESHSKLLILVICQDYLKEPPLLFSSVSFLSRISFNSFFSRIKGNMTSDFNLCAHTHTHRFRVISNFYKILKIHECYNFSFLIAKIIVFNVWFLSWHFQQAFPDS